VTRALSLVVPAYNEGRRIERSLLAICHHLDARGLPYEVIAVDGLSVVDVTDPTRPQVVATLPAAGGSDVAVSGRGGAFFVMRSGVVIPNQVSPGGCFFPRL
jgi:hypothetical protein